MPPANKNIHPRSLDVQNVLGLISVPCQNTMPRKGAFCMIPAKDVLVGAPRWSDTPQAENVGKQAILWPLEPFPGTASRRMHVSH